MNMKLENISLNLMVLETCFSALEKFIDEAAEEKTLKSFDRLYGFFYLVWDKLAEIEKELNKSITTESKEKFSAR